MWVRGLLYLWTAQQRGAGEDCTVVAGICKIDHRVDDLGQEADRDDLASHISLGCGCTTEDRGLPTSIPASVFHGWRQQVRWEPRVEDAGHLLEQ